MAEFGHGSGEQAERARQRRKIVLFAGLFCAGLAAGVYVGLTRMESLFNDARDWPPALAIGLAAAWLGLVAFGSLYFRRLTDEFERETQLKASALAGTVYFLAYPVWFLLWKGGLVPEPMHGALFILFWFVLMSGAIGYRFR